MNPKAFFTSIGVATCLLAAIGASMQLAGCASPGDRPLEVSGPYQGDYVLWTADVLIDDIGDAIEQVDALAARNPAVAARPEVAKVLAEIRRQRDGVVERNADGTIKSSETYALLITARDFYKTARTQAAMSDLQSKSVLARAILEQARNLTALLFATPAP